MLFQKIDETFGDDIFFAFILKSGNLISPFVNSCEKLWLLRTSHLISSFLWSLKHRSDFILNSLNNISSNIRPHSIIKIKFRRRCFLFSFDHSHFLHIFQKLHVSNGNNLNSRCTHKRPRLCVIAPKMIPQLNRINHMCHVLWSTSQNQIATEALIASVPVIQGFDDDALWLHRGDVWAHLL